MKAFVALIPAALLTAQCARTTSNANPPTQDASAPSPSRADASASPSFDEFSCARGQSRVDEMTVSANPPNEWQWRGKFSLHVHGCGFRIGAMPWMMQIGSQFSGNGLGDETDLSWPLETTPAIGDELFIGYGNADTRTGLRFQGLDKAVVAPR